MNLGHCETKNIDKARVKKGILFKTRYFLKSGSVFEITDWKYTIKWWFKRLLGKHAF